MSRRTTTILLALALLALPEAATAQRPSLLDLDATLDQVVNGLCNGDASTCGTTPTPAVAGQIDILSGTYVLDFTDLSFGLLSPGLSFAFEFLVATVDTEDTTALLLDPVITGQTIASLDVRVPDPQGPGDVTVLRVMDVRLESLDVDGSSSLAVLKLSFSEAEFTWLGAMSGWDDTAGTASGCQVAAGEKHVALAGNDPSLLGAGDVEAGFAFGAQTMGVPTLSYTRASVASSPCYLRSTAQQQDPQPILRRLSPLSDTFGTQLHAETVDLTSSSIESYRLSIDASGLLDTIVLDGPPTGKLTTKTFDAGTGVETGSFDTSF